jgi:hypothetical protein
MYVERASALASASMVDCMYICMYNVYFFDACVHVCILYIYIDR